MCLLRIDEMDEVMYVYNFKMYNDLPRLSRNMSGSYIKPL